MYFTLSALTIAALAMSKLAVGTVITGTSTYTSGANKGDSYQVAWIDGQDACQWAFIANAGENPCQKTFTLSNGYQYQLGNCGTPSFALYNEPSGSYNSIAHSHSYTKGDCVNSGGPYSVSASWSFY